MIVLDASVAVEIVLNTEYGRMALDHVEREPEVHVPEHFHVETISALRGGVSHITADGVAWFAGVTSGG